MKHNIILLLLLTSLSNSLFASKIKGLITDKETNEPLIGAIVKINELNTGTVTGLDGSFKIKHLPKGVYTISVTHIGYETSTLHLNTEDNENKEDKLDLSLSPKTKNLNEVEVVGHTDLSTDASARFSERESPNLLNVTSASAIQLSPDLEVSSVVQRMSGVTLDKSSSKGGEYAILRGMDKRYSYTLVNGIKIASTDDRQRYTTLDIFPSELVDRVEVFKALTPDMESDAIAGGVNIVMKNAPDKFYVSAHGSTGYNTILSKNQFMTFNSNVIARQSPYEVNGKEYQALSTDFTKANLDVSPLKNPINSSFGFAIGNRFLHKRIGWVLAANYNNAYKGKSSMIFGEKLVENISNEIILTGIERRFDYTQQQNLGIHNKLDFQLFKDNSIKAYIAYFDAVMKQNRESVLGSYEIQSYVPSIGQSEGSIKNRNYYNIQSLLSTTLQGDHGFFSNHLVFSWSAIFSKANNQTPDLSSISYDNKYKNFQLEPPYVDFGGSKREWFHNSDQDKAGYANLKYKADLFTGKLEIASGYLYRDKVRSSFVNTYTLKPLGAVGNYSEKGVDWNTYSDINWSVEQPRTGAVAQPGTFDAYERERAYYGMIQYQIFHIRIIGGVRHEQANQGYDLIFHNPFLDKFKPGNNQKRDNQYVYNLPSGNIEYSFKKGNIKASYYKALNKPGFLEIVPFLDNRGDYPITGNPDLRNSVADNYDFRYEFLPNQLDQVFLGAFYKKIKDAIEEGFVGDLHGNNNLTFLNSDAKNYGIELDGIKFIREFGVKFNYTWTHSLTSSSKRYLADGVLKENGDSTLTISVARPMAGQSEHIANLSFLYKGADNGVSAQIAVSYTGERIIRVSPDLNGDVWQKGFIQLDCSAEKKFKSGLSLFAKAKNLLNTHSIWFLKYHLDSNNAFPYHEKETTTTLLRDEYSSASILVGIRYKLK